mgnify:CR=1 FL=1
MEAGAEALWKNVGAKVRNLVRKAEKAGLTAREGDPGTDLDSSGRGAQAAVGGSVSTLLALVVSYLLGSMPAGEVAGRMAGVDLRSAGSGNGHGGGGRHAPLLLEHLGQLGSFH